MTAIIQCSIFMSCCLLSEDRKINTSIILPVVSCACHTWFPTLRDKQRMRVCWELGAEEDILDFDKQVAEAKWITWSFMTCTSCQLFSWSNRGHRMQYVLHTGEKRKACMIWYGKLKDGIWDTCWIGGGCTLGLLWLLGEKYLILLPGVQHLLSYPAF